MTTTEDYVEWLYESLGLPRRGQVNSFKVLLQKLHDKEFVWVILHDSSRAEDGKELRWEFVKESGLSRVPAAWMYSPCSVLEMIIGVARRMAVLTETDYRIRFVQILHNLEFSAMNDSVLKGDPKALDILEEKIERLIWRNYRSDGYGGMFPLKNPPENQKNVDIWYQLNRWLIETENNG